jgi:predicted DNA-binding WGR domain protein
MKTVYLENRGKQDGSECAKFFRLEDNGHQVMSYWGAIGAKGQQKALVVSEDPVARQAAWDKKLREKTKRKDNPYQIIRMEGVVEGLSRCTTPSVQVLEQRPSAVGRRWGLEVETHSNLSPTEVAHKMLERGLKVQLRTGDYFPSDGGQWDVKRDASCGYEFASPILSGDAGIFDAKLAVEKIREVCSTAVNSRCGLHVTIDVSDHTPTELKRLAIAYLKAQEHFYAECNPSRQHNHYCQKNPTHRIMDMVQSNSIERVLDACGGWRDHNDRYHGLNWTRVFTRKVVEFRMMESTVAVRKVGAWIRMCVGFVDGVRASRTTFIDGEPLTRESFETICGSGEEISRPRQSRRQATEVQAMTEAIGQTLFGGGANISVTPGGEAVVIAPSSEVGTSGELTGFGDVVRFGDWIAFVPWSATQPRKVFKLWRWEVNDDQATLWMHAKDGALTTVAVGIGIPERPRIYRLQNQNQNPT